MDSNISINEKLLQKYNILFEQASQAPNSPQLLVRLGDVCLELNKRKESLMYYKKAINLDPGLDDIVKKLKENFSEDELKNVEFRAKGLPFWQNLGEVARYPFAKQGIIIIIAGAILFAFLGAVPLVGGLITIFLIYPYVLAYMYKVIKTTANGKKDPPDWPSDIWEEIIRPVIQIIAATVVSSIPSVLVFIILVVSSPGAAGLVLYLICVFLGSLYFPMALISVVVYDNFLAPLNFPLILRSIWQIKKHYFLSLLSMWTFAFIGGIASTIFPPSILLVGPFIFWIITLYFAIVQMHILGNVYYINKHNLKWL